MHGKKIKGMSMKGNTEKIINGDFYCERRKNMKRLKRVIIGALAAGAVVLAPAAASGSIGVESVYASTEATTSTARSNPTRIALNTGYIGTLRGSSEYYFVFKTDDVKSDYILYLQNNSASSHFVDFRVLQRSTGNVLNIKTTQGLDERVLPGGSHTCKIRKEDLKPNSDYIVRISSANSMFGNNYKYRLQINHTMLGKYVSLNQSGKWVFYNAGRQDMSYTGVARSTTGNWVFVKKGVFNPSYTGVARSTTGNWVYVKNGRYYTKATGVARSTTGNFVYVRNGRFYTKYTGLARSLVSGDIVYVKNGRYYPSYNGKAVYNGKTYTVRNGRV